MPTIQIQLALLLATMPAKPLLKYLGAALKQAAVLPGSDVDEKTEARLRASQQTNCGGQKLPEDTGFLLIDTKQPAKLLNVSERHVWRISDSGCHHPCGSGTCCGGALKF